MTTDLYLAGQPPSGSEPLARYLPPIPEGVISEWLQANLPRPTGEKDSPWLLDPFGNSPRIAIEAAQLGYKVFVAANNPIARFLLEMVAKSPREDALRAVLADLSATRKGDERLEPHIRSLYLTHCDQCGKEIEAEAFLWERIEGVTATEIAPLGVPYARVYHCPFCNASGEFPAHETDIHHATQFSSSGLHRARALERVSAMDDPDRRHAEEALEVYLPRAVYALFTLINKLDGMPLSPEQRKLLVALLLSACDKVNTLWSHPTGRARPRALTIPPRFREYNLWFALEQAIPEWASERPPVPVMTWPDLPPTSGGITIFEGRLKDLVSCLNEFEISAVLAALPRPNQAFWTLSALWAGWLFGREAVGPFKSVLRRRRYDWAWHTTALQAAFESLAPKMAKGAPFFSLIGEAEPGFLSAAIIAADHAGFDLAGLAMPAEGGQAQITWQYSHKERSTQSKSEDQAQLSASAAVDYLQARGEPVHYLPLHTAALVDLSHKHALGTSDESPAESLSQINAALEDALTFRRGFLRLGGSEKSLEVGYWWLREAHDASPPLHDRVEMEIVRYLIAHSEVRLPEAHKWLCTQFPGLLTPEVEFIHICLESYGEETQAGSGIWRIQPRNTPQARRADIQDLATALQELARFLGYSQEGEEPLIWRDPQGQFVHAWYVTASAIIAEVVLKKAYPPGSSMIALPGSRANLVAYKLQHDPRLRQVVEEGWRFVKFRQIRWLAQTRVVTRESLDNLLAQDTLTYESPQLRLF